MDIGIEFTNETEEKNHIAVCLRVLYSTPIGSVALDRAFGLDWSFLDLPLPAAKAQMERELIQKTQKYEPRARVQEVRWSFDSINGRIKPKVVIAIV